MALRETLRRHWEDLQKGEPGRRFQDRYERAHESRGRKKNFWERVLKIGGGVVAIAIGLIEIVFPGPAIVFIFIGGALLASE